MDPLALIVVFLALIFLSIVTIGFLLMAQFTDIAAAQAVETQAIVDLTARLANSSGITTTEADQILANVQTNTSAIAALVP